ncbi:MAG TPA: hypothetical protein VHO24_15235 [Opitutaceae bacterium]|nr:hypothetical protein [Opitutaceae bacterium]
MNRSGHRGWLALAIVCCAIWPGAVIAQRSDVALSDGYRISSIKVAGRWSTPMPLPLVAGEIYNPAKVSEAIGVIKSRFASADAEAELLGIGLTSVAYITARVTPDHAARTVDIVLLPYAVRLAVGNQGENFLPLPRSPFATEFAGVPGWLRTLNPQATVSYDQRTGLSPAVKAATTRSASHGGAWFASAAAEHALTKDFFDTEASAGYRREFFGGLVAQAQQLVGFLSQRQPNGAGTTESTAGWADTQFTFRLPGAPVGTRLVLGGRLQSGTEKSSMAPLSERDLRFALRALGETRFAGGNARAALWLEHGRTGRGNSGDYQRAIGLAGYVKEIPVGIHRSLGFELSVGAGTLHGAAPAEARFVGGAQRGSFLYDGLSGSTFAESPRGPQLRNFGRAEAGVRDATGRVAGGDRFIGGSFTLSLPVRAWSRPLLPGEPVTEIEQPDGTVKALTLGDLLQRQVKSGQGIFAGFLEAKGAEPAAAAREAESVFGGLQPAIAWLAEQANLVALKPVLMCDAAQITRGGQRESWLGVGAGIQLVIVTAKLEAGYMGTVKGPRYGHPGSFSARLVFQNLF